MPAGDSSKKSWKRSRRFDEAVPFAIEVHRDDTRKGSDIPYIGHLLGVCSLVIEEDGTEDQAIAALLHDTAEDHGGREMLEKIEARFGERVMKIVEACSDTLEDPKPDWRPRKEKYLKRLGEESEEVLLVSLADKLYNARAIVRDYRSVGDKLWDRFSKGRDEQLWYYRSLRETYRRRMPDARMTHELADVVGELARLSADQTALNSDLPAGGVGRER
jgi:(p)ppGpp synthase/HD superfamily hydrolase